MERRVLRSAGARSRRAPCPLRLLSFALLATFMARHAFADGMVPSPGATAPTLTAGGGVVAILFSLLSGAVNLDRLRRKPPIEVDINSAVKAVSDELHGRVDREVHEMETQLASHRTEVTGTLGTIRQGIKSDVNSIFDRLNQGFAEVRQRGDERAGGIHSRINVLVTAVARTETKIDLHMEGDKANG